MKSFLSSILLLCFFISGMACHKKTTDLSDKPIFDSVPTLKPVIPLIEETAQRLKTTSPSQTMTGPATRNDEETIKKHLALLKNYPKLQQLYKVMTDSIRSH